MKKTEAKLKMIAASFWTNILSRTQMYQFIKYIFIVMLLYWKKDTFLAITLT